MQTIIDLNKKVSYRLIKALYFFVLIGTLIFGIKYFYEDSIYSPMDYDQTRITCLDTEEHFDIKKSRYDIGASLTNEQKNTIAKEVCGTTGTSIIEDMAIDYAALAEKYGGRQVDYSAVAKKHGGTLSGAETGEEQESSGGFVGDVKSYDDTFLSSNNVFKASQGVMIEKLDLLKFSGYLLGTILGLLLITEVLRRTIYYVFLGSLKPRE